MTVQALRALISEEFKPFQLTGALRTSDGKEYDVNRQRAYSVLVKLGVAAKERSMLLSGEIPISPSVLRVLVKDGSAWRKEKPYVPSKRSLAALDRKPRGVSIGSAQNKLNALAKRYSKNWKGYNAGDYGETSAEDAAPDAALGFFHEYPEWEELARTARMQKYEVRSAIDGHRLRLRRDDAVV